MRIRLLALRRPALWLPLLAALWLAPPSAAVTIDWVQVGDPGNPNDVDRPTCGFNNNLACGSVAYVYQIAKYEVTNSQYAEFLNAVADADPNGLYDANMDTSPHGGITRSGVSGSYSYSVKSGYASKPVVFVTFYDATRFANWLENGQPTGAQGLGTTEDGSYTITPAGISANTIARDVTAMIFVPSENEWMKAAYYDTVVDVYYDYPTTSNFSPTCTSPTATANRANCLGGPATVTDVGGYTGSASPNGTFDQAGNVWEWTDDIKTGLVRRYRGSGWDNAASLSQSGNHTGSSFGASSFNALGFRLVLVPEPGTALLLGAGLVALGTRRRRRSVATAPGGRPGR
jgi:formylglycine-generating enzyme required for sulfatase activity